ncbi:hypothetical protein J2Z79_000841 [Symbiobacterium terraclitae]|jgi:hypothetical protein|uniref:CTP-dependent riboflavin kinase n=1 Tax=Symbiobacterium terraclitae TaxID=557451 RepID=A0ABS4JPI8_9FIRM|nr:DUF120 domain-containing protein [Symbiobacterium terraclitae]MBP2017458.1 hypothetical protein [Symbiobacterium terraclitae]
MGRPVRLLGRVATGLGAAGPATSLDWFRTAMRRLWGFTPRAGTLNVIVEGDWRPADRLLLTAGTVLVPPTPDLCCSLLLPARIETAGRTEPAVLFRPLVQGYNPAQLELLAPVRLRDALDLRDGDLVTVTAEANPPAQKWLGAAPSDGAQPPAPAMAGLQTGQADITVDLSTGPLHCKAFWAITEQGISVSLFGGIPHVGATALAIPRPSLKDPTQASATSSVLTVTGHKDDVLARLLAESLAVGLNRVVSVTAGVHAGPEGVYDLSVEDLKRIMSIVGRMDEVIRMAVGLESV